MHEADRKLSELKAINHKLQKDIYERDLFEEKLRSSEAKVRATFEAMTDIVFIVHVENNMLNNLEVIPTNYSKSDNSNIDLISETIEQFFQDKTRLTWLEKVDRALKSAKTINYDYSLCIEDTKYWFSANISPISETQVVWVARDISERKRTEIALKQSELQERNKAQELEKTLRELKLTQSRLLLSEKMASLGSLVAGIAHEINNPTNFIYGNSDIATNYVQDLLDLITLYQKHYPKPATEISQQINDIDLDFIAEDFPHLLDSMKQGANRITQIVQSLRDFSHHDEANYKRVDIHAGIDNTILLLEHRINQASSRKIQIIKEYAELPKVECYPSKLNQVFMNVLSNAIDALEEGIEKNNIQNPYIRIFTEILDDKAVIHIVDNGIGINQEVSEHLFDPFFTTKTVGKGIGMGLAISYQIIVDNHQGELQCISEFGKGAEFIISIPLHLTV
ncbi:ATP-binding protein [Rivularia sp. UHCC 0363]|uniref:PAS domain-containing sensor histidine kinase n=1 Tax=Rivularia sp. UHCC 0363 TaxID=3110244 RepID=UPI002B1FFD0E|nr:ATP-binding protein [Rivularia sp. UHCC 0363]MEA5598281.1 ATP-binding protein [Rivularia sp. UHCC 0363]